MKKDTLQYDATADYIAEFIVGFVSYPIALFLIFVGASAFSRRYLPPYSDAVGIMMWVALVVLPFLPALLMFLRSRSQQEKPCYGSLAGAVLSLILTACLLFVIFA